MQIEFPPHCSPMISTAYEGFCQQAGFVSRSRRRGVCVCARSRVSVCQCVCLRARARYLAESTSARISEALIGCELGTAVLHVPIGSV